MLSVSIIVDLADPGLFAFEADPVQDRVGASVEDPGSAFQRLQHRAVFLDHQLPVGGLDLFLGVRKIGDRLEHGDRALIIP